jgi:hypothetical protein
MRALIAIGAVGLSACAAQQPARPPGPSGPKVEVTKQNLHAAIHSGHKIIDEKGRTLYCKIEPTTGSRIQKTTICLTEEEWDKIAEMTRTQVERSKTATIPQRQP